MRSSKARDVARTGLLFALAVVLSWLESCITPLSVSYTHLTLPTKLEV